MSPGLEALTPEERKIVLALRDVPESPLRDLYATLVSELTDFVAPCNATDASCDQCRKLESLLEGLRSRLHAG